MSHKSKRSLHMSESASDLLAETLTALDAIIADARRQEAVAMAPAPAGRKRGRGDGVFAVMAGLHLRVLQSLVVQRGVQLAPSLDAVAGRVLAVLAAPAVASCAAWEAAAALGTYFRAGAARLLAELAALLLGERGPFLLAAARVTGAAVEGGDDDKAGEEVEMSRVVRNLRAFEELLLAAGPFVDSAVMQQATMRFAQEVVVGGILDAPPAAATAADNSNKKNNSNSNIGSSGGAQERDAAALALFSVEEALRPVCVDLLTSFLLLCRPLPGVVSACAVRVVKELPGTPITAGSGCDHHHHLLRAVTRLSVTLMALRHPHALPFYLPPVDIVEKPTRRAPEGMSSNDNNTQRVAHEESPSLPVPPPLPVVDGGATVQPDEARERMSGAVRNPPAVTATSHQNNSLGENHSHGQQQQQQQPVDEKARSIRQNVSTIAKRESQQKQRHTPVKATPPTPLTTTNTTSTAAFPVPPPIADDTDDEDDMPDIDMED